MTPRPVLSLTWVKDLSDVFTLISAGIGGALALIALLRKIRASTKQASATYDKLMSIADTFTPEVLANLTTIATQLRPNGGSSMMDKVSRIETAILRGDAMRQQQMNATGLAFWEADAAGLTTYASDAAASLMGVTPEQAQGNGWVTNVLDEERSRVFSEWLAAVQQQRAYVSVHTYVYSSGKSREVHVHASPIVDNAGRTVGFVGVLRPAKA